MKNRRAVAFDYSHKGAHGFTRVRQLWDVCSGYTCKNQAKAEKEQAQPETYFTLDRLSKL
jgi:hypothetical protein